MDDDSETPDTTHEQFYDGNLAKKFNDSKGNQADAGTELLNDDDTRVGTKNEYESQKGAFLLYCCVLCTVLLSLSGGTSISWTSPVFPKFDKEEENPFGHSVSTNQKAWIAGLLPLGAVIGPMLAGFCADKFGRKVTLLGIGAPICLSYLIIALSKKIELWYFARFIQGLSKGSTYAIVPMYLGEITQPFNRGKFSCFSSFFLSLGIFYPLSVGPYLNIRWYALSCAIPSFLFMVVFSICMPESPYFLASKNNYSLAELALKKLRPKNARIQKELKEIQHFLKKRPQKAKWRELFQSKTSRRCLLIAIGLMFFEIFSGLVSIFAYMKTIFESSGSRIDPNICTLIIGTVKCSFYILCITLVEKVNRKTLLMTSMLGCSVTLCSLGTYFFLKIQDFNVGPIFWLPVTSLVVYNIFFCLGLGPMVTVIIGEIFPLNIKALALSISVTFAFIFSAAVSFFFPLVSKHVGMCYVFWTFSVNCLFGTIFVYFLLPETRGKSLAEIQDILRSVIH